MATQPNPLRFLSGTAMLALAAALAVGCAVGPSPTYVPSTAAAEARGLEVRLPGPYALDQGPWAVFHLSKPAYVAIFDVRPGLGVEAVYPSHSGPAAQRRFHAGMNTVLRQRGYSPFRFASGIGTITGSQACLQEMQSPIVYRMIIASERPLSLERVHSFVSFQMRPGLRSRHFAFGSPLDVMDDLLHMVLPAGAAARPADGSVEWAADYVAYWHSDPGCARLMAMAPFSPVQRLGSGLHPVTPEPPIEEPGEDPGEPGEDPNGDDIVVVRPDAPAEAPDRPAPPLRDRDDGLPGDRPTEIGNADARTRDVPTAWRPEERDVGTLDGRGLDERGMGAERQRLLPERTDPGAFERLRVLEGRRAAAARPGRTGMTRNLPGSVRDRLRSGSDRPLMRPPPRTGIGATLRPSSRPSADRDARRAPPPARVRPPARPQVRPSSPPPRSSSESGRSARDSRDSRD